MSLVESNMLPLGTKAPDFKLPDTVSGKDMSLGEVKAENATVVMFLCNHCPYVIHVNEEIVRIVADYKTQGVGFVGISSNDVINYPQDSPEKMKILGILDNAQIIECNDFLDVFLEKIYCHHCDKD